MRRERPWQVASAAALCFGLAHACSFSGDLDGLSGPGAAGTAGAAGAGAGAGAGGAAGAGGGAPSGGGGSGGTAAGAGGGLAFSDRGLEGGFGAGTFDGSAWDGDHVALGAGRGAGRFVSRVFDAGGPAAWSSIAWEPGAPYRKPLPGSGGEDAPYRQGRASMAANVLLLHFDETSGGATKLAPVDASGEGHEVVVAGAGAAAPGPFGLSLDDELGGYVFARIDAASGLNFGTSDFTWALWVKTTQPCPSESAPSGNRVHLGAEDEGFPRTHLWLGCTSSAGCPGADGTGRAGGTFCTSSEGDACVNYCGRTVINDGAWHHVAVVKRGHFPGALRLFVDGAPDLGAGDRVFTFSAPLDFEPGVEFAVGGFSRGTFPAAGAFDEVAVFRRALGDDELGALYRRGALGLGLRVRVCARPDCSDAEFVGPAGPASAYVDAAEGRAPTSPTELRGLPPGRYFQYEASLESTAPGASPELYAVEIVASPL
ncbi:MAG TPA: LamG domain-containing protein [Polyangiaceae bacterium]|nr:LamG domain-containing protein [Polyangiaceae bacterium]